MRKRRPFTKLFSDGQMLSRSILWNIFTGHTYCNDWPRISSDWPLELK